MTGSEVRPESEQEEDFPIRRLECCIYRDTPEPFCEAGFIYEKDIPAWLADKPKQTHRQPLAAGLRLVWVEHTYSTYHPFSPTTCRKVHRVLGIPQNEGSYLLDLGSVSGKYSVTETRSVYISYRSTSSHTSSFVITHDSVSNVTTGYVLFGPKLAEEIHDVFAAIQAQFPSYPHPLLVPTVLSEATAREVTEKLIQINLQLRDIEVITGFANWADRAADKTPDFPKLTRGLGELSFDSSLFDLAIRTTLFRTEFMLQELKSGKEADVVGSLDNMMRQRVTFLKGRLEHLLLHGAIKDRLQAQQTVLFNLIAQEDSRLNISIASDSKQLAADSKELAAASKRDSSSMKIIAILTTLFLPGTFLSALLAMPMFNWDAPTFAGTAGPYLWFYWAVAIPLTVLIMGFVGVYAWYQGRINEKNAQQARRSIEKNKDV